MRFGVRRACHRGIEALALLLALFALSAGTAAAAGGSASGGTTPEVAKPSGGNNGSATSPATPKTASGKHGSRKKPSPPPPATTPPMGWDSWDSFGCGVNERDVEQAANWLVASGLRDAGYRYVIIDDCWYAPTRSANGSLRPNTSKFPTGMRWLGWYLHSRGLLFGIYASGGQSTCAQLNGIYPGSTGSMGHEQQDARTFASWGVDYVKYDWCSPEGTVWQQIAGFRRMLDALRATGRPMVFSINPNSFHTTTGNQGNWSAVSDMVRTAPDLAPVWDMGPDQYWYSGVLNAILDNAYLWPRVGPRRWNDPDSLVVGMKASTYAVSVGSPSFAEFVKSPPAGVDVGLTYEDMRSNMAMWAMMASPLIIGADVPYLGPAARDILLNPSLIAIDQDPLGQQARPIAANREVWFKPLSDGSRAAALFNPTDSTLRISTNAGKLGLPWTAKYTLRDAWTGAVSTTRGAISAVVPPHGADVLTVSPVVVAKKKTSGHAHR